MFVCDTYSALENVGAENPSRVVVCSFDYLKFNNNTLNFMHVSIDKVVFSWSEEKMSNPYVFIRSLLKTEI